MKFGFRDVVVYVIGIPLLLMQFAYPILPNTVRPYARPAGAIGLFVMLGVVIVYNKLRYGTFFPGPPRFDNHEGR
jgi:hypothetical protein